jgi:hypothetical protein
MTTLKRTTGAALVSLALFGAGFGLLGNRSLADPPQTGEPRLTEAEFAQLKSVLDVKNQPWASIPWKYSITEARKLAAASKKPIFMVVNTGNALGCV